jgi:transposase, IS5 family
MKPRERRETGEQDLFRSRLDQIIDLRHPLVKLSRAVDWAFLERTFGEAYTNGPGQPPLPTRLMAGLIILKYTHNLSDEALCERWVENPYYQYFCGEEFFQHELVLDRSSLSNWRKRMGEEKVKALLQESLSVATKTEAVEPSQLSEVIVDTTVQPKNVMFPTDARLMNRAREILVRLAKKYGVELRQSYARVGKFALIKHQRYAHAKQFKRANKALKKLRTYLGRTIRDIARKIGGDDCRTSKQAPSTRPVAGAACAIRRHASAGRRSIACTRRRSNASARARRIAPYEFGVKVSVATTLPRRKAGSSSLMPRRCRETPMTVTRWQPSSPTWSAHRQTASRAFSPMPAIAATTRRPITSSGSSPPARRRVTPEDQARDATALRRRTRHRPHQGRAPHGPQLSRWDHRATPSTPSSPPPATTSASSSTG